MGVHLHLRVYVLGLLYGHGDTAFVRLFACPIFTLSFRHRWEREIGEYTALMSSQTSSLRQIRKPLHREANLHFAL